jgi:serpin B
MKLAKAIPLTLATGVLMASCASPGTGDPNVERPEPDSPHVADLTTGLNDAGYRMFHAAAADSEQDVVLSSLSIGLAFGMLDVGATGNVAAILTDLFGYRVTGHERWSAFNTLEQSLVQEGEEGTEDTPATPTLRIANRAFQDEAFTPVEGYNENILTWFGAGIETLALREDPEGSRAHINEWVAERTQELIPELLPEDSITPDVFMVLVNALYLKAAWQTPFEDFATDDADFTLLDGTTVTVPLMHNGQFNGNAYAGEGYSAIDVPYYGDDLSMLVIAPDAGNYAAVEERLGSDFVSEIDGLLENQPVDFFLPRFESESDVNLRTVIENDLGISGLFEVPELGGIHPDAAVTDAVHSAKIIVDEEGTEAAAATAIMVDATSAPPPPDLTIRVDRPFMYVIRDHETGAVLFVGRVLDPS